MDQPAIPTASETIRLSAAAKIAGLHPTTISRMIQRGDLTGWRFGNAVLLDRATFEATFQRIGA